MSVSCVAVDGAETHINKDIEYKKEKKGQNKSSEDKDPGGKPSAEDEKIMSCEDRGCPSPVERRHQQSPKRKCRSSENGEPTLVKERQQDPSEGGQIEPSQNSPTQAGQWKWLADGEQGQCQSRNDESLQQAEQEPSKNGKNKSSSHIESGEHQAPVDAGQPTEIMKPEKSSEKGQCDPPKSGDSESSKGLHSGAGERKGKSGSSKIVQKQVTSAVVGNKKMKRKKILTRISQFWSLLGAKFDCCYQLSTKDD